MYCMVCGTVDTRNTKSDSVVNVNCPHGDEDERDEMHGGVKRKQKDENLIGSTLKITVERMKCECCERGCVNE